MQSSDGFLLFILGNACREYGWSLEYVKDDVDLVTLILLLRTQMTADGKQLLSLKTKEALSSMPFEELLKKNREQLKKMLAKNKRM